MKIDTAEYTEVVGERLYSLTLGEMFTVELAHRGTVRRPRSLKFLFEGP